MNLYDRLRTIEGKLRRAVENQSPRESIVIREMNENDWAYLSGAENFPDGTKPVIREDEHFLYVAGRGNVQVISNRDEDEYGTWQVDIPFPNGITAGIFMMGLPKTIRELEMIGFHRIN